MVEWAKDMGATALNFQPMDRWTQETYDELWIEEDELPELQKVVDKMLELKRKGEPIINSELVISLLVPHFREQSAPPEAMPCRVGMRDFFIRTNGDIEVCFFYPADRQHQGSLGPRDLVRPEGPRDPQADRRVRPALPVYLPLPEDPRRQGQDGPDPAHRQEEESKPAGLVEEVELPVLQ